jgi:ABC-type multidrug transport system fused ATPase/permease subunit
MIMGKYKLFLKDWRNQSRYIKWLWKYTKPYLPQILFLLFLGLTGTFISISLAIVTKRIIDATLAGGIIINDIAIYVGMMAVTLIISAVVSLVGVVLDERFSFGIRKQLYEKIIHSHWMDVTKYHTGDLMTRLTSDAKNIADGIIYTIPTIINLAVQLIVTFAVLYYYEPFLAILALVIAPVAALTSVWLGRKLKVLQVKVQESEAAYRSFLQESLSNIMIVKAFVNEDYSTEKLVELREERFYWVKKKNRVGVASTTVMSLAFQLGYIAAFTFGAFQVSSGAITYGTMTVFLTLVNRIQSPILQLAQSIPKVVSVLASTGRVIEIQTIPIEKKINTTIQTENIGVNISNLTFGYHEEEMLFDEASINFRPGEFVAIVGDSGIGKTTLVRLMMSFLSHNGGNIVFQNELGEQQFANAGTRQFIAYVPQGNTLFSGTIKENIHMGRLDATEEEMIEALEMASALNFINELPKGLDTVIGEKGHGLSEGQAQRIAIARAFIRKAPFLILDEATSALDEQTELAVLEGVKKLKPRPTCLLITHRRSVLAYCDREIRIKDRKMYERTLNY